jgi:hypothetical protein
MLRNSIPGLTRGVDPTIPRQILKSRLKVIDSVVPKLKRN